MSYNILTTKEKITLWFHRLYDDEISPSISLNKFNDILLNWLKKNNLEVYNQQSFRKSMCNALCVLKENYDKTHVQDLQMKQFPNRKLQNPDWKDEFNELWDSYIQYIYTTDVIHQLCESLESADWEHSLPNWKIILCSIFPYFIKPSVEVLENEGYLVFDEKDEYITYDDAQEEKESDYY